MNVHSVEKAERIWFVNARVPGQLAEGFEVRAQPARDGLVTVAFGITPDGQLTGQAQGGRCVDLGGRIVLPTFVDSHVHLDKSYIVRRTGIPDGGLPDAVRLSIADAVNWTEDDLRRRMTKALERAFHHGASAMRTHIDMWSMPAQSAAWRVISELREQWRGRIELQIVALMGLDRVNEANEYAERCRQIKASDGILGVFIAPGTATDDKLDAVFRFAAAMELDVDFHVDETIDPSAQSLELICDSIIRTRFDRKVVAGHCCSLGTMPHVDRDRIIEKIVQTGVHVISLPMSNLFLQDRACGTTPSRRGLTAVHELRAAGASVHFGSDNVQDPFYPYGDYDMLTVFRIAVSAAHLDVDIGDWLARQFRSAATACGFVGHGRLSVGSPANLIIFDAMDFFDLMSMSPSERLVLRNGRPIRPASINLRNLLALELP